MNAWKMLGRAGLVDLLNFKEEDIYDDDIRFSLEAITRFNGHYIYVKPLNVYQHSQLVYELARDHCPSDKLTLKACIIHDFAEAFYGDITTPVKIALNGAHKIITGPIDRAVERKYIGFELTDKTHEKVSLYDKAALYIEYNVIFGTDEGLDPCYKEAYKIVAPKLGLSMFASVRLRHRDLFGELRNL